MLVLVKVSYVKNQGLRFKGAVRVPDQKTGSKMRKGCHDN